jgi:hypothetical protein
MATTQVSRLRKRPPNNSASIFNGRVLSTRIIDGLDLK